MTDRAALLRQIRKDARPFIVELVELNKQFTKLRKLATAHGLDWGQIKALLRAEEEDGNTGTEKVDRIIKKAKFAAEYAAVLGIGAANMNKCNSISADLPPHDADGVLIEDETAPVSGDAGAQAGAAESPSRPQDASPTVSPIVVPPPQTIAAVVASTSRDAPAASPFEMPDIPKFLERRIA